MNFQFFDWIIEISEGRSLVSRATTQYPSASYSHFNENNKFIILFFSNLKKKFKSQGVKSPDLQEKINLWFTN